MMTLEDLKKFNLEESTLSLWVFKKSGGAGGSEPVFTGRWLETTEQLDGLLKNAVRECTNRATEVIEYGILAQNNEASVLTITALETHAGLVLEKIGDEISVNKVSRLKHIANAAFYVVKMVFGGEAMYAFRKTDASWQARRARGIIPTLFSQDEILDVDATPKFNLARDVDFFVYGEDIFIVNKGSFESVLNYRAAHLDNFSSLCEEEEFLSIFSDVAIIIDYVGTNKMQLRRALAIRSKGHYKDPDFMRSLRDNCVMFGLRIDFDEDGKIHPRPETCRDIFQALLDHRLKSHFSQNVYDVQDAASVQLP
jgi:hypothetical protein